MIIMHFAQVWSLLSLQLHILSALLSQNEVNSFPFLPRDAYAQRGLCRGKMSVCPSVCHMPVLCLN